MKYSNEIKKLDEDREQLLIQLLSMQEERGNLLKKMESLKKNENPELLKELTSLKRRGENEQGKMRSLVAYYKGTEMDRLVNDLLEFLDSSEYLVSELIKIANANFGYFKEYQHIVRERTSSKIRLILLYFLYCFKEDFVLFLMEREMEREEEKKDD